MNPLIVINKINDVFNIVIENKNLDGNASDVFEFYSGDFCSLLLRFFPSATVMTDSTYKRCALLINGVLYNSKGIIETIENYKIANTEEQNYIRLGLDELSEDIYDEVCLQLKDVSFDISSSYTLRKNSNYLA